ncbi:MAG: hypothetical protein ACTSPM_00050 [Candidatus Heimdallarchaeota archaeon]
MSKTSEQLLAAGKNCVASENSNCSVCELDGKLICKVDKKFANQFMFSNIMYRMFAITLLVLSGLLIGHWWMLGTYIGILLLTFLVLEPRLLCSHCPYYELDGKFLKCWALRGLPKLWKYRPEPMKTWEKIVMLFFGAFIDLFPYVGAIWGIVWFAYNVTENLPIGISLISMTVIFSVLVVLFGQVLLGNQCKKCPNFSCTMNKVPKEQIDQFLNKNKKMKDAWLEAGWKMD